MNPKFSLPVLLVTACNRATAEEFVSELIDNEVTETTGDDTEKEAGRVWRLVNKYYSADVLVRVSGDLDLPPSNLSDYTARVEAHVIYFTPNECAAANLVTCAEHRMCTGAAVRVAALRATSADALVVWAARARYEPVALQDETEGMARVREALHAHLWPGLHRLDRTKPKLSFRESEESSSGGENDQNWEDEDDEDMEHAEQFALALGALAEVRANGTSQLTDAERRARAEEIMAAFCQIFRLD